MTQGITSLPGAQQAPGQAAPVSALPPQQPMTPQAMTGQLQNLPPQQLLQMFANPADKTPKWAVVTAYAKAVEQQRLQEMVRGQQAMQQGQMQAQEMPVAAQVMSQPVMARHGGEMHGYAGGGAVAFQTGASPLGLPFPNDAGIFPVSSDMNPGETREEYIERKRKEAAESREMGMKGLERLLRSVFPESKLRKALYPDTTPPVEPGTEGYSHESLVGLRSKPEPPPPVVAVPPSSPASGASRAGAGASRAGAAPAAPTGGIADLAGPNIDPYLLSARDAQRLLAEAAMRGAQPTEEQQAARRGLDTLMGNIVTERQAEEARRLTQAQKRIDEALERSKRAPLEDITYLGQMLEGMRGSKRFGEALAGAAAGAGRAQMARQEALRKAEERYDISRNDIATLANLRQQVQLDQAKAVEARASGDARSMQAALLDVAKSKQQLAEFEAGLADKAEGRSLQRQQLALTVSEGAADRALRERLAAAGAVPAEARFLEWLRSNPKNRELYESVQEIKGEENRRLKLYEIYTKNKLSLGDMSFEDFLAGFKGVAGAGTAPPPGAVRVKGQ